MDDTTATYPPTNETLYQSPVDSIGIAVSSFIIFTLFLVGIIGNGLTLAVITTYNSLNTNVFMRFILSLCVSDLMSALISWLFLYRRTWGFDVWEPMPSSFCKIYWSTDIMTSFSTALHIFSFAVLRLISIKFPLLYNKIKLFQANIWITCIWLLCFLCGFIPSWIIFGAGIRNRLGSAADARWPACTGLLDQVEAYSFFQKTTYPIFLYVPIIGVVSLSLVIAYVVKMRAKTVPGNKKGEKRQKKEKQAVLQLFLIIVSFLLGYVPFTVYEFWGIQAHPNTRYYQLTDYWFGMIEYFLLRFSECLNPMFYNLGSAKVRKYTKLFLKNKIFCCINWKKKKVTHSRARGVGSSSISNGVSSTSGLNLGV